MKEAPSLRVEVVDGEEVIVCSSSPDVYLPTTHYRIVGDMVLPRAQPTGPMGRRNES